MPWLIYIVGHFFFFQTPLQKSNYTIPVCDISDENNFTKIMNYFLPQTIFDGGFTLRKDTK